MTLRTVSAEAAGSSPCLDRLDAARRRRRARRQPGKRRGDPADFVAQLAKPFALRSRGDIGSRARAPRRDGAAAAQQRARSRSRRRGLRPRRVGRVAPTTDRAVRRWSTPPPHSGRRRRRGRPSATSASSAAPPSRSTSTQTAVARSLLVDPREASSTATLAPTRSPLSIDGSLARASPSRCSQPAERAAGHE